MLHIVLQVLLTLQKWQCFIYTDQFGAFPIEEGLVSPTREFKQSLNSFYVTDSPLSVTNITPMAMLYIKLTSLSDFSLEDEPISPTGQFKQSLDSFYVTDSPLSVTNIAQIAMFYLN